VVNVAQEALAGISFQANSPRSSARPDSGPAPGNDSFAALVDGNAAARDDRRDDSSRAPPASARRNDDPPPTADPRSRDDSAGPERPERDDVGARNDTGPSDRTDKPDQADSKSDTPKPDSTKSSKPKDDAPAKGDIKDDAKDGDESKQDDGTAATTVIAATVSAVVSGPADAAPATPPVSDTATAPLATAAAAIAAVASVAGTAPAAANAVKADAQTDAQAIAAVSDSAQAVGDTATTGIALSAAASSATPQAKAAAQSKPTLTAKDAIPTSGEQDGATDSAPTDAPTGIVPDIAAPTAAAGKQKAEHAFVDAVKADASGNSAQSPAAHAASHTQTGTVDAAQTLAAASDNGAQAAGMIQPQVPSTPATPSANSQLAVTAATHNSAVPVSGLAMEIAASAKSGKSRFEIRLDPPELGRIDVRIHVDNNGQVTSHLTVERPETLQMLRQDANQLQRALDNAGLSTGNSGLQFSLRDQSSSGQNGGHQSNPNAHRLIVSEEDSVPATVAGRSYGRMLGASGGVDIRV
jgi:flagellar hook-length control protein FliK